MIFFPSLLVEDAVASLTNRLNSQLTAAADALMGSDHGIPLGISFGVAFTPLQEKIDSFSKTITKCLRSSDIIYQSRPNHFFIVLTFLYANDLQGVIDRLKKAAEGNPGLGKVKMEFAYSFTEMEKNSNLTNRK